MDTIPWHQRIANMRQSLLDEGILDDQFKELENLADDNDPNFMEDTINDYFNESSQLIADVEEEMEETFTAYKDLDDLLVKLKGSSAIIGARRVKDETDHTIECCREKNLDGAKAAFQKLKTEQETLKARLDPYFELLKQSRADARAATGGADPK